MRDYLSEFTRSYDGLAQYMTDHLNDFTASHKGLVRYMSEYLSEFTSTHNGLLQYIKQLERTVSEQNTLLKEIEAQLPLVTYTSTDVQIDSHVPPPYKDFTNLLEKLNQGESFFLHGHSEIKNSVAKMRKTHPNRKYSVHQHLGEDGKPDGVGIRCWRLK